MNKEEYLLVCLSEECSEVIQRINKAQRFGLEEIQESNPDEKRNNRERIIYELRQLITTVSMLMNCDSSYVIVGNKDFEKEAKVNKYMNYSKELGILI